MRAPLPGPTRDHDVAIGCRRQRPELVREPEVVTHEEAAPDTGDLDGEERIARGVVLGLGAVPEGMDLGVAEVEPSGAASTS